MTHRAPPSPSPFSNRLRSVRRPSRLVIAAAAAAVAGMTSVGLAAGGASPAGAAGNPGAVGRAGTAAVAGRAGGLDATLGAVPPARARDAAPALRPHHAPARVRRAPAQRHRRQITRRHPARIAVKAPVRNPVRPRRAAAPAAPYVFYDSVLPTAIPAHGLVATYATGPYAASPAQVAGRGPVLWIDVYGTDYQAMALDVEPSDATPSIAATWVWHRLSAHPNSLARLYTSISEWPAVQAAVATLPAWMRLRVRWWIADPTGVPHLVPGSDATQWYWGSSYDMSTATPRF